MKENNEPSPKYLLLHVRALSNSGGRGQRRLARDHMRSRSLESKLLEVEEKIKQVVSCSNSYHSRCMHIEQPLLTMAGRGALGERVPAPAPDFRRMVGRGDIGGAAVPLSAPTFPPASILCAIQEKTKL